MKNITVAVGDDVYRRARVIAAERETSISALVGAYLRELSEGEDGFERALQEERRLRTTIKGFRVADRLSRDEVYRRRT